MKKTCFFFVLLVVGSLFAQAPRQISFQGVLTDANSIPVADGNHTLVVTFYDQLAGGISIYTETIQPVATIKGLFTTIIGRNAGVTALFDKQYFIGVAVDGGTELNPALTVFMESRGNKMGMVCVVLQTMELLHMECSVQARMAKVSLGKV